MSDSTSKNGKTPEDVRSLMLSKVSTAVAAGNLADAALWATQAVETLSGNEDREVREQVNTACASIIMAASLLTRKLVFRAGGIYHRLVPTLSPMLCAAELITQVAKQADRGIAHAHGLVLEGNARQILEAAELHPKNSHRATTAGELDKVLNALAEIIEVSGSFLKDADPNKDVLSVAREGIDSAKGNLSPLFPKKWSDWEKAAVLVKQVRKLIGQPSASQGSLLDGAEKALGAQDYTKSSEALGHLSAMLPPAK